MPKRRRIRAGFMIGSSSFVFLLYKASIYEGVSKILMTGAAIYTAVVVARRTTMSSESVCQVSRSWVEVGSFHTCLVERFMIFTASVRNILDTPS
jgi:hypothetical protein